MSAQVVTKEAIVTALAGKLSTEGNAVTKAQATAFLDALGEVVTEELVKGSSVKLSTLGTIIVKDTKARTSRNPRTGETVNVPASKAVRMKASKQLSDAVKAGPAA